MLHANGPECAYTGHDTVHANTVGTCKSDAFDHANVHVKLKEKIQGTQNLDHQRYAICKAGSSTHLLHLRGLAQHHHQL